ncbi:MAG TPA: response regulator [Planctomycetaceae bacterium]|nr:response regulator [Planctomycetaceae bacterium]HQZ67827.1 response regulator [Planctomycetaceae bacterium]HRA86867.1 response regulator [Planctomycetaceae bacterium]
MTQKTVLSVGQCRPDTATISQYLTTEFGAKVMTADLLADTLQVLESQSVDLVLINRKLDADDSDGMEILKQIRANQAMVSIPVMLVSNFPEWQEKAVLLGATYGFGKAELNRPETKQRLSAILEA